MKNIFWKLDKLGWVQLSKHFYFRQFLYSEIAAAYGMANIPDDPDLAIQNGKMLCENVLEPIVATFGSIIVRSGYRSSQLNEFGCRNNLMCGSNESNFAYHIWDKQNADGFNGAAACIVVPEMPVFDTELETRQRFAEWLVENVDFHSVTFYKRGNCFNIGWHERPVKSVYNLPTQRYLIK